MGHDGPPAPGQAAGHGRSPAGRVRADPRGVAAGRTRRHRGGAVHEQRPDGRVPVSGVVRTMTYASFRSHRMLRALLAFCLSRRAIVLLGLLVLLSAGLVAFSKINIEAYPNPAPVILE